MADVNCYCIVRADGLLIPDLLIDLIDGKYLSRILYKQKKDIVLDGGQLNGVSVYGYFLIVIIDLKAAAFVDLAL